MATTREAVHCVLCGFYVPLRRMGMDVNGKHDSDSTHDMVMQVRHYGGRGRITVEKQPVTVPVAIGLLAAIDAARARVVADLQAAGVEVE
jgi:hypothetical protein